jgi:hypothetical protein
VPGSTRAELERRRDAQRNAARWCELELAETRARIGTGAEGLFDRTMAMEHEVSAHLWHQRAARVERVLAARAPRGWWLRRRELHRDRLPRHWH